MFSYTDYLGEMCRFIQEIDSELLIAADRLIRECGKAGGKIMIAGNGGSAAIASHVSVDLTKAAGIRSICFNEADLITCFANDFGYERWVEQAIGYYGDPGDVAILISSSGQSKNIINAADKAKTMGIGVITMSGFQPNNPLRKIGDVNFWVNSTGYNYVEGAHQIWLLAIVDRLASENPD